MRPINKINRNSLEQLDQARAGHREGGRAGRLRLCTGFSFYYAVDLLNEPRVAATVASRAWLKAVAFSARAVF